MICESYDSTDGARSCDQYNYIEESLTSTSFR